MCYITDGAHVTVKAIEFNSVTQEYCIKVFEDFRQIKASFLKPITLTKEILLRCGFNNSEEAPNYFYHNKFDRMYVRFVSYNFIFGNKLGDIVPIDYVHKLQNIFSDFTEEELTINL